RAPPRRSGANTRRPLAGGDRRGVARDRFAAVPARPAAGGRRTGLSGLLRRATPSPSHIFFPRRRHIAPARRVLTDEQGGSGPKAGSDPLPSPAVRAPLRGAASPSFPIPEVSRVAFREAPAAFPPRPQGRPPRQA